MADRAVQGYLRQAQPDGSLGPLVVVGPAGGTAAGPLAAYRVSDEDSGGTTKYYGFVTAAGEWYILRQTETAGVKEYRYAKGDSGYATAWANRATQTYERFDVAF